jgi:hypothetical protein
MKNKSLVMLFILLIVNSITVLTAQNTSLEIRKTDNSELKASLSSIQKISFSGSDIVINYTSGNADQIALNQINKIIFGTISGLNNMYLSQNDITVFPNPATDFISLKNVTTNQKLIIYSVSGLEIMTHKINVLDEKIDINQLKQGIYIIRVDNRAIKFTKL